MHVMFVHPNFPAQFGFLAHYLTTQHKWTCTFVTSVDTGHLKLPYNHINYRLKDDDPLPREFHNPETYQGHLDHLFAIYRGLRGMPQLRPDLVVGHVSYGTMLYLRNLYPCPFVGFHELLPPPFWTEKMILRKEFPPTESVRLFNATYHAMTYLQLHAADRVYTPTEFQKQTAPAELHNKIEVFFDGVDAELFQPRAIPKPVQFRGIDIAPDTRVVTYVSRGLESVRGFDIFMRVAKRICAEMKNVLILVSGEEITLHGHETSHLAGQSFKSYVLGQDEYDLSRIHFLGQVPIPDLAALYNLSDLHIHLTVPYMMSASLPQAMASGCCILASDTVAVREFVTPGIHAQLADFHDVDGLAQKALQILRAPAEHRFLGEAARRHVLERHDQRRCLPRLARFFEKTAGRSQAVESIFSDLGKATP